MGEELDDDFPIVFTKEEKPTQTNEKRSEDFHLDTFEDTHTKHKEEQIEDDFPPISVPLDEFQLDFKVASDENTPIVSLGELLDINSENIRELELFDQLKETAHSIINKFNVLLQSLHVLVKNQHVRIYFTKLKSSLDKVMHRQDKDKAMFLFKDGPVTEAVKTGRILLLEDFDLPSQAVVERLNSLLETEPTFNLTEDITVNYDDDESSNGQLAISSGFQVFATIHQENEDQKLKLSPAVRSRFTEIRVESYSDEDIRHIVENELRSASERQNYANNLGNIDETVRKIVSLRKLILDEPDWRHTDGQDVHILFRWLDFICREKYERDVDYKILLGAKFFYLEKFKYSDVVRFEKIFDDWWKSFNPTTGVGNANKFQ